MNRAPALHPTPFTGRKFLLIMVGFFGVVIAVNVAFAVIALKTFTGLVVDDSYGASQSFDRETAKVAADAARDIHARIAYSDGTVKLSLVTAAGAPIAAKTLELSIGHPVGATSDVHLQLQPDGPDAFAAPATLNAGPWQGKVEANLADGTHWARAVKMWVK